MQNQNAELKIPPKTGMYRIYKADYDNVGRMAYCYSVSKAGLRRISYARSKLKELLNDGPSTEVEMEPRFMFEPTSCQTVRFAVSSIGANVNRNFWLRIGGLF